MQTQKTNVNITRKRLLGKFYTPAQATSVLCKWVIRSPYEQILEPSFGGCGFLEASRDRLKELGSAEPTQSLFGCDIDQAAFRHLERKIGAFPNEARFIRSDFLEIAPTSFPIHSFDIVIGNPPYVSSHNMSPRQRTCVGEVAKKYNIAPWGHASLWAYFLVHSMAFLKEGGRMAWILPGSLIQAQYAEQVRTMLQQRFERVLVISLGERLFVSEGTDENSVIVVAEGYLRGPAVNGIELGTAKNLEDFDSLLESWYQRRWNGRPFSSQAIHCEGDAALHLALDSIKALPESSVLKDIVDIKIGIVTGANRFFIIDEKTRKQHRLPISSTKLIFSKSSLVKGVSVRSADLRRAKKANLRCQLLNTAGVAIKDKSVRNYLRKFSKKNRDDILTFKKRKLWHQPDDGMIAGAFFSYMNDLGPRIFLNEAKANCTNSLYRIFFRKRCSLEYRKLLCISMWTTYSQLCAEFEGRIYGQGILKHEPSDAGRVTVIAPTHLSPADISKTFSKIDRLLRAGKHDEARRAADTLIFGTLNGVKYDELLPLLDASLVAIRSRRKLVLKNNIQKKPTGVDA